MLSGSGARRDSTFIVLLLLAWAGLCIGWNAFWFLTDDSFIAFRYVSSSVLGRGYVWNPPPFLPVEGYTSFLWVALLDGVWRVLGVEPPRAANLLSLLFAAGTLAVTLHVVVRLRLRDSWEWSRPWLAGLVLLGCVTNRTFLAWSSSGLGTALFGFLVVSWVHEVMRREPMGPGRGFAATGLGALLALARPEGALFLVGAAFVALVGLVRRRSRPRDFALAFLPLLLPAAHLAWRHSFYGEWLPNTYYAKVVEPWPAAGARYLLSFVLEYAVWMWLAAATTLGIVAGLRALRARSIRLPEPGIAVGVAVLAFHALYYTFMVGGDHFEYRIYSHLVPLLWLSFVWILHALGGRARTSLALAVAFVVLGWPLPWIHWWHTRHLDTRDETLHLQYAVAPSLPPGLRWYGALFDDAQSWLIERSVCSRHQEHKVFVESLVSQAPTRERGSLIAWDDELPIIHLDSVGYLGWVLPNVAVIDKFGLNDYVVARTPRPPDVTERLMAHERLAPRAYLRALAPSLVHVREVGVRRVERQRPLRRRDIVQAEKRWRRWVARSDRRTVAPEPHGPDALEP